MPNTKTNIKYTTQCRSCWGKGKTGFGNAYTCWKCRGTGVITGSSLCKYCMEPCDGCYCPSCYKEFER